MRPIIEFCVSNLGHGIMDLKHRLEQNPDYDVVEYGCLGNCEQCYFEPFAMVNGEVIAADSAEELERAIGTKIKELEAWNDLELD